MSMNEELLLVNLWMAIAARYGTNSPLHAYLSVLSHEMRKMKGIQLTMPDCVDVFEHYTFSSRHLVRIMDQID